MAFTRHFHHIPGTLWDNPPSVDGALCGGPRHCKDCKADVDEYNSRQEKK